LALPGVLPADSIQNCFNAAPMDVVVDGIHRLLDTLPPPNTFLFDIFCICDQVKGRWAKKN
jgi:hypothetical protein